MSYAAIVLAGGSGRRMNDPLKILQPVRGVPMLHRVLAAVREASPTVVVGPPGVEPLPEGVLRTREEPPGGGPVSGIAAGLALCGAASRVAVLAGDMPLLTAEAVEVLLNAGGEVALYVDDQGRRQSLCAVWSADGLRRALGGIPEPGKSVRSLLAAADVAEVTWPGAGLAPWLDCDTAEDLERAEQG